MSFGTQIIRIPGAAADEHFDPQLPLFKFKPYGEQDVDGLTRLLQAEQLVEWLREEEAHVVYWTHLGQYLHNDLDGFALVLQVSQRNQDTLEPVEHLLIWVDPKWVQTVAQSGHVANLVDLFDAGKLKLKNGPMFG